MDLTLDGSELDVIFLPRTGFILPEYFGKYLGNDHQQPFLLHVCYRYFLGLAHEVMFVVEIPPATAINSHFQENVCYRYFLGHVHEVMFQ